MVVTIECKVTINGKFYATGPWYLCYALIILLPSASEVLKNYLFLTELVLIIIIGCMDDLNSRILTF